MAEQREPGEVVERAVETLRALPPANDEAIARIVATAARARAEDASPNEYDLLPVTMARRPSWLGVAALATAATIGVVFVGASLWRRGVTARESNHQTPSSAIAPSAEVRGVALTPDALDAAPVPTQFVFEGKAHRVALVGDFNNWDEHATLLEREPRSSLWSVTVPIQRGRHMYAFLVDSTWTVDKRAPVARDPDFGVTGSVIIVGRP